MEKRIWSTAGKNNSVKKLLHPNFKCGIYPGGENLPKKYYHNTLSGNSEKSDRIDDDDDDDDDGIFLNREPDTFSRK